MATASRNSERLLLTYSPDLPQGANPENFQPVSIGVTTRGRRSPNEVSKTDVHAIADGAFGILPTLEFDAAHLSVYRTWFDQDGNNQAIELNGWRDDARREFGKQLKHMADIGHRGHSPFREAVDFARRNGGKLATQRRKETGEDKGVTWGGQLAKFIALNPVTSLSKTEEAALLLGIATDKIESPFLVPSLGIDTREIKDHLRPGSSVDEMKGYLREVLRTWQAEQTDAGDAIHGVGKALVEVIDQLQRGLLKGTLFNIVQSELPQVRAAIEFVVNLESMTSANPWDVRLALLAETRAYNSGLTRKLGKRTAKIEQKRARKTKKLTSTSVSSKTSGEPSLSDTQAQDATPEESTENAPQNIESEIARLLSETHSLPAEILLRKILERGKKHVDEYTPHGLLEKFGRWRVKLRHGFLNPSPNVFGTMLDRRNIRQKYVTMEYLTTVLNTPAETLSIAEGRYKYDLATALVSALEEPVGRVQEAERTLSENFNMTEERVLKMLEELIPPNWINVLKAGLDKLSERHNALPQDYREDLHEQKRHEEQDPFIDYFVFLKRIADKYASEDGGLSHNHRTKWRQSAEDTQTVLDLARSAYYILFPERRTQRADAIAGTQTATQTA